jgi:hypothetical protein
MKNYFFLTATTIALSFCFQTPGANNHDEDRVAQHSNSVERADSLVPQNLFNLGYAEKIMGQPMHLTDNTATHESGHVSHLLGYKANSKDIASDRPGAIYFLIEQFDEVATAHDKYASIKTSNEHNGIKPLNNLGDEAYFHTDGQHFYFIMVRKGKKLFNMKVNKITPTTSLEKFNAIAKKITETI